MTNDSKGPGGDDPSCCQNIEDVEAANQKLEAFKVEKKKERNCFPSSNQKKSTVEFGIERSRSSDFYDLDALPVHLLRHIGQTVLELSGVESFIQLTRTSKYIHQSLMEKDFLSSILESTNEWIYRVFESHNHNYFKYVLSFITIPLSNKEIASLMRSDFNKYPYCPCEPIFSIVDGLDRGSSNTFTNMNPSVTTASNLEELDLCQTVANAEKWVGLTLYPNRYNAYRRLLHFIADTVIKHRSVYLFVDLHGDLSTMNSTFERDLMQVLAQKVELVNLWKISKRIFLRRWRRSYRKEPVFFEIGFRLGGIVIPPLRSKVGQITQRNISHFYEFYYNHSKLLQDLYKMDRQGVVFPPGTTREILRTFVETSTYSTHNIL